MRNSIKILFLLATGFQLATGQGLWEDFDENQEEILQSSSTEVQVEESSSSQALSSEEVSSSEEMSSSLEVSSSIQVSSSSEIIEAIKASSSVQSSSLSSSSQRPLSSDEKSDENSKSSSVENVSSSVITENTSSSSVLPSESAADTVADTAEVTQPMGGPRDIPAGSSGPQVNQGVDSIPKAVSTEMSSSLIESSSSAVQTPQTPQTFNIPKRSGPIKPPGSQVRQTEEPTETLIPPSKPEPLFPERVNAESSSSPQSSSSSAESLFKIPFQEDQSVRTQAPVTHIPLYKKEKGNYVSPRQAGFSSLALPGLGQFQIPGISNKVKGSLYLLTEVALGFSIWYFGIEKQQEYIDKYKKNQSDHFSILAFEEWAQGLNDAAQDANQSEAFSQRFDASRSSWCRSLYGSDTQGQNSCIERSSSHLQFVQNQRFRPDNSEAYYQFIGSEKWVAGWSDSEVDSYSAIVQKGEYQKMGSSKYQDQFNDARDQAEFYGSLRPWLITALVLNHLISAVDAAWSAETNNESLYEAPIQSSMSLNPKGEWVVSMSLGMQW